VYCVINAVDETTTPAEPMTSLGQLTLAGAAAGGTATSDSITTAVGATADSATGNNYFPDLGTQWQEAEFNVFGDGGGSQAVFNSGANLVPRTEVISGATTGPGCHLQSWTGETSNLTLVNSPPPSPGPTPAPALVFSESNPAAAGAPATCADAVSIGDTHLMTFNGLFYDFQASGDFTLAEVGPGFEVQTRQVSGAPTWPNASVNKAVAARFGKTQVAICPAAPETERTTRVFVDGKLTPVNDGETLILPQGVVGIRRRGTSYLLIGEDGDSVRATVNAYNGTTWIDVNVGLGHWPSAVKGLIANAGGNVNQVATRDNLMLTNPFRFDELYHRYADSWRVAEKSMLSVCSGGGPVEHGIPKVPFYAKDLEPNVREKALAVCNAAGVKPGPLLDACTLDVAVIGQDAAAKVFVSTTAPTAVGTVVGTSGPGPWKLLLWLLLLLAIIVIVWLLVRSRKTP
jgi:hypothetical protein